ncbi:MAG: acetylxylan esterase, partial [Armatimonadetes bacterium]|nr:acetylxylan esterase [Armatimonadota bacterium]
MLRHAASLLLLASLTAGQEPADSLRVYTTERERYEARTTVTRIAFGGQHRLMQEREAAWAGFTTPAQFAAWQAGVRGRLAEYFGPFPERTPLKPRLVQTIDRPAYAIEKIVFESRPGYLVTANFYRPKGRPLPLPGVFFTCGHGGEGKGYLNYHACCLGLVLKGYAVLAIDPMGQGERQEYFETAVGRGGTPWPVAQHQQLLRPSWLVGRTLSGYRVWDGIRAVDYLISRPEVDSTRLAAVGNSGGGQMALLVTAADPRIAVCAAGHPGGSCENAYLNGYTARDRELLALIPPRPCRVIVGRDSGENHADKVNDMQRVYQGLGAGEGRGELVLVDGVHNLEQPKRVAVYEWLNRWLGKEVEGAAEPSLETLSVEELWATPHGSTIKDLGSQSGTSLNSQALDLLRPPRPLPADAAAATREAR